MALNPSMMFHRLIFESKYVLCYRVCFVSSVMLSQVLSCSRGNEPVTWIAIIMIEVRIQALQACYFSNCHEIYQCSGFLLSFRYFLIYFPCLVLCICCSHCSAPSSFFFLKIELLIQHQSWSRKTHYLEMKIAGFYYSCVYIRVM